MKSGASGSFCGLCSLLCHHLLSDSATGCSDLPYINAKRPHGLTQGAFFRAAETLHTGGDLLLEIRNLTIQLDRDGRYLVKNLTLSLAAGEKAVLAGEEGNGKSTLLKAHR